MAQKLRIAVLGAGGISQLAHIPIIKKHRSAELVAISDIEFEKAAMVADRFKIPHFYRDPDKIFARDDIDAVHINTPTNSHMALTLGALSSGKHVLVEKPMARKASEAHRMVEASKTYNRRLMVAMNLRFRPDSMILHKFVEGGELGSVKVVRGAWLKKKEAWSRSPWLADAKISGGGVLMDLGIQVLDACLWVMGFPKVERVTANCMKDRLGFKVEDTVHAYYVTDTGASINLNSTWAYMSTDSAAYTIFSGTKGMAELNPLKITKEIHGSLVNVTPAGQQLRPQNLYKKSYEFEIDHFYKLIQKKTKPLSSAEDGAAIMDVIEATYRSAAEGREVIVGEA